MTTVFPTAIGATEAPGSGRNADQARRGTVANAAGASITGGTRPRVPRQSFRHVTMSDRR
jgi:hypothetical protein